MTKILAALAVVLLTASVGLADCGCGTPVTTVAYGPAPVVVNYASYPAPVVAAYPYTAYYPAYPYATYYPAYPAPYVVARPVVAVPGPVVYGPAVVYGVPRYARPWVYMPGQPVRNTLRATFR